MRGEAREARQSSFCWNEREKEKREKTTDEHGGQELAALAPPSIHFRNACKPPGSFHSATDPYVVKRLLFPRIDLVRSRTHDNVPWKAPPAYIMLLQNVRSIDESSGHLRTPKADY